MSFKRDPSNAFKMNDSLLLNGEVDATETTRTSIDPNTNSTQQQQQQQQQEEQQSNTTNTKPKKTKSVVAQKFHSIVQCVQTKVKYRSTMEGMIRNTNRLLDDIINVPVTTTTTTSSSTKKGGSFRNKMKPPKIPSQLFEQCRGIVFLSVVEVGMMLTGNIGTGIVFRKQEKLTSSSSTTSSTTDLSGLNRYGWSLPSACGMSGIGWGIMGGASLKDIIVFIMDDYTMEAMVADKGIKIGGQIELTIGTIVGQTAKLDYTSSATGMGSTIAIAYTKGLFAGISIEGALLLTRNDCNTEFYCTNTDNNIHPPTARDILYGSIDYTIEYPATKVTKLADVYDKLNLLSNANSPTSATATVTTEPSDTITTKTDIEDDNEEDIVFEPEEGEPKASKVASLSLKDPPPSSSTTATTTSTSTTTILPHQTVDDDTDSESDIVIVEQER